MNTLEIDSELGHQLLTETIIHADLALSSENALLTIRTTKRELRIRLRLDTTINIFGPHITAAYTVNEILPPLLRRDTTPRLAHDARQ